MQRKIGIAIFLVLIYFQSFAQVYNVKVMSWNLLNYPDTTFPNDTGIRNPYFRDVMQYVFPQIVVTVENTSINSVNSFLNNVLNANGLNQFSAGTFIDGYDTDNAIYFRNSFFQFISNTVISTNLRNINEFKLLHISTGKIIRIYACHLKAGSTASDQAQRAAEVLALRAVTNALPTGTDFIVCGDFNTYSDTDACYLNLLQDNATDDGNFIDPISMTGTWSQPTYSLFHTQSTRQRSFGGGSTGGLDDRFDLILYSNAVAQTGGITYIPNSTTAVGNDGWHHNDSINQQPNPAVPVYVADALHYASDHLPVTAVFTFQGTTGLTDNVAEEIALTSFYDPATNKLSIHYSLAQSFAVSMQLLDMKGRTIKKISRQQKTAGKHFENISTPPLSAAVYLLRLTIDAKNYDVKFTIN